MKKTDLINEVSKVTATKKEAAMAVEIILNLIKKTLKNRDKVFSLGIWNFQRHQKKGQNWLES